MERYGRCAAGTKGGLQASERNEPTVYSRQPTVKEQGFRIRDSGFGSKSRKAMGQEEGIGVWGT